MRHVQLAGRATLLLESCCTLILVVVPLGCNNLTPSPVPVPAAEPAAAEVTGDALRERLDRALELVYSRRRLNSRDHAAWQVVHGAVAFGRSFPLEKDGQLVGAVDYLLGGGELRGWNWEPGDLLNGRRGLRAIVEPGSQTGQGHYDQWLGYLAACDFPLEQPIRIGAEAYTLADLVAQVEWDVPRNVDREFSWTLMGLTKYRPTTHQWEASDGETWSIPQLVGIEAEHDLNGSACGGAHRLCGLVLALQRHQASGGVVEGPWLQARDKVRNAVATAREYQNSDGSLSSNFFQRPGKSADLAENLGATGHVLEFLALEETDEDLRADWIRRAALFLCDAMERTQDIPLECGGLYHSASGLVIYRERLFGKKPFHVEALQTPVAAAQPTGPAP